MTLEQGLSAAKLAVDLLRVLVWPVIVLFIFLRFGRSIQKFIENLGEFSLKAAGVEASAKRQHIEAAALLGAAEAARPRDTVAAPEGQAREIADLVSDAAAPSVARRLANASILWVDDRPENNTYERQALEALGIHLTLASSTEEALQTLKNRRFDVIISDMGRPPDPQAGYTLLDALKQSRPYPPFIIYAGSNAPEHKAETRNRGGWGTTNRPQELFQLVLSALREQGHL